MMSASMFDELLPNGELDGVGLRVGVVIENSGRVLLLEPHSSGPIRPTRKLPGATVQSGESVRQAVERGVLEETGLQVTAVRHHIGDFDYLSPQGRPVRRLHFAVEVAAFEPIVLSAHGGFVWAPLDGELGVTSSIRGIIDNYRNLPA